MFIPNGVRKIPPLVNSRHGEFLPPPPSRVRLGLGKLSGANLIGGNSPGGIDQGGIFLVPYQTYSCQKCVRIDLLLFKVVSLIEVSPKFIQEKTKKFLFLVHAFRAVRVNFVLA